MKLSLVYKNYLKLKEKLLYLYPVLKCITGQVRKKHYQCTFVRKCNSGIYYTKYCMYLDFLREINTSFSFNPGA